MSANCIEGLINVVSCESSWVEIQIEIWKGWCTANTDSVYSLTFRILALRQRENWFLSKVNVCWEALRQLVEENWENDRLHNLENVATELKFQSAFHISTSKLSSINITFCCYPYLEENTCCGVLKEFPQRLLQTFDELGTKTGTKYGKNICPTNWFDHDDLFWLFYGSIKRLDQQFTFCAVALASLNSQSAQLAYVWQATPYATVHIKHTPVYIVIVVVISIYCQNGTNSWKSVIGSGIEE